MNRAAARSYPFQVIRKFMFNRPGEVFYIGGNDILPAPLSAEREAEVIEMLGTEKEKEGKSVLIEHNLRLVVYIAKKFDNTGVGVEDLISIGTIGLIKAINTFDPVKNIKLATYASRCIENEILMYLRRNSKTKMEVSIDEPLNVDWDGNELLLSDILGTDDHPSAIRHRKPGRKRENTEGGSGSFRNFAILHFSPGKADHEAAAERNRKV